MLPNLLLCCALIGPVAVEIDGPPRVDPGDLATFKAKGDATAWRWELRGVRAQLDKNGRPTGQLEQFTPGAFMDSAGHQIGIAVARPATVYVFVAGTNAAGEIATASAAVEIQFTTPPPPPPVPPTPPPPPVPDGKYKLAPWAYAQAASMTPPDALALGGLFRTLATETRNGSFADPEALMKATAARAKALPVDSSAFRSALADAMRPLTFTSKPLAEFAVAFEEIATGLEARK